jgi:purine catabolism regulator
MNQMNTAETARQLYIHRNSLLYRIEKIQRILHLDLKDSDELLKLQLALKIYHMLHQKN